MAVNPQPTYYVGSLARISVVFTDPLGALIDPTTVVLVVHNPDGTDTTFASPLRDSQGAYHQDVPVSQLGIYNYEWQGSGSATAVTEGYFRVSPSILSGINPSPLDLTTVGDVKDWLAMSNVSTGVSLNTQDRVLQRLVTASSVMMLSGMNRSDWRNKTTDERRNGNDNTQMCLKEWPVVSVNSVSINGTLVKPSPDGVTGCWTTDGYSVFLIGSVGGFMGIWPSAGIGGAVFTRGYQNVVINYTRGLAGLDGNPLADIAQACIELVAQKWARKDHIDLASVSAGQGQTTSYQKSAVPVEVDRVIKRYKLYPVVEV